MKSVKLFLGVLFMGAMVMLTGNTALAKTKVEQSALTPNSVTVRWTQQSQGGKNKGTTSGYEIRWMKYADYSASGGSIKLDALTPVKLGADASSYQISSLLPGTRYMVKLTHLGTDKNGAATSESEKKEVYTAPGKVTGLKKGAWNSTTLQTSFSWTKQDACSYEWEVLTNSKAAFAKGVSSDTPKAAISGLSAQMCYIARVRAYVKDPFTHQNLYGEMSDNIYLFGQPVVTKVKRGSSSLKVYWKKITGATSYKVFISTGQHKGYKKGVAAKKTKGYATVKKYKGKKLSKKKVYYVYVVAEKKVGKKTYKSKITDTWKVAKKTNKISKVAK